MTFALVVLAGVAAEKVWLYDVVPDEWFYKAMEFLGY